MQGRDHVDGAVQQATTALAFRPGDDAIWPADPARAPATAGWWARLYDDLSALLNAVRSTIDRPRLQKGIDALADRNLAYLLSAAFQTVRQEYAAEKQRRTGEGIAERFIPPPHDHAAPLVSIVIPCVNDGRFVRDAHASALAQTFTAIEVIVVDGGSDDGTTPDIVASLRDPRTRCFLRRTAVPCGLGDNRNYGIARARGAYVCCLDADDVLLPTFIEKALFLLEHGAFDVAGAPLREFGASSGTWTPPEVPTLDGFSRANQTIACALFRKLLWSRAGGYANVSPRTEGVPEDWDFWIRLAALGARFRNIQDEPLVLYRRHAAAARLSSHLETVGSDEIRRRIVARNRACLTPAAARLSQRQAHRQLQPASSDTAMRRAMARHAGIACDSLTVMILLPHFMVGGAERVLSQVAAGLGTTGWRAICVATDGGLRSSVQAKAMFEAATPETYVLDDFLRDDEALRFLLYLIDTRRPHAIINAGSRLFYRHVQDIEARDRSIALIDLLFNTQGHVEAHLASRPHFSAAFHETEEVRRWLIHQACWHDTRLARVTNGVDRARFRPGPRPADLAARLGIGAHDVVVGWAGRYSREKRPELFVELARHCIGMTNVRFIMAGHGPLQRRVEAAVASLPDRQLRLLEQFDQMPDFYRLCDFVVVTSAFDGRPNVILEAQASGCVVVTTAVGGIPDMVRDGVTGVLVRHGRAADFATALIALIDDPDRTAAMRRAGLDHVPSAEAMIESYRRAVLKVVTAIDGEHAPLRATRPS